MKLSELLKDQTMISAATVDSEGKPKVRMFNHQFIVDGKICFATANVNSAYSEIEANPFVEIMQFSRGKYIRVSGKVVISTGEEKAQLMAKLEAENPKLIEMYTKEGFDAKMEVVYFEAPEVKIVDMAIRQPVEVTIG